MITFCDQCKTVTALVSRYFTHVCQVGYTSKVYCKSGGVGSVDQGRIEEREEGSIEMEGKEGGRVEREWNI